MKLTLVNKIDEARDTKSFFFTIKDRSQSETPLSWIPGQYIYITLPKLNYNDERGDTRHFTISSSPSEGEFMTSSKDDISELNSVIRVTVRVRQESGYKKTLDELPIGTVVEGKGPQGTFILDEDVKDNIFIAGGIGITPFRSMIKYNIDNNLKIKMHLIYSNSDSEFVFKDELDKWQSENDYIKVTYFDSSVSGHLDSKKLSSLILSDIMQNTYYAVGPNAFVNAMEEVLEELKIPGDQIITEKFTGY